MYFYLSLTANVVEPPCLCLLDVQISFPVKFLFLISCPLFLLSFDFFLLIVWISLFILSKSPLLFICATDIFFQPVA